MIIDGITVDGGVTFLPADPIGQVEYTTAGTYTWTAPENVTRVCVVCVGGGGGAGTSYGGGSGAGPNLDYSGSPGGSGVVIIKAAELTGSPTVTFDSVNYVYKFTQSGTITF